MKEIRDIKMDRIMGIENPIDKKFQEIWNGLSILNCDVYNKDGYELIYFNSNREWIFYQDSKNEHFWCNYERYWSIFELLNIGKYEDIQVITKYMVEDALNNSISAPEKTYYIGLKTVEDALNNSISTPIDWHSKDITAVEDALNNSVSAPKGRRGVFCCEVEDALNNSVSTPKCYVGKFEKPVEDALNNSVSTPKCYVGKFEKPVQDALSNSVSTPTVYGGSLHLKVEDTLLEISAPGSVTDKIKNKLGDTLKNNIKKDDANKGR